MTDGRKLLTRDEFREAVFARDHGLCVNCSAPGVDAHHIIERRLFVDGGYYLDNGALLCAECHLKSETTELSVEEILSKAGITRGVRPGHIPDDEKIDKWGNQILPDGTRMRGEMFHEEQVQKILARGGFLDLFSTRFKYPRTFHLPWSPSVASDDKVMRSTASMQGRRVIGTIKMDGENTTFYRDHFHARSIDGRHHPSRDSVKAFWNSIAYDIPEDWRICGENLFAVHSIEYNDLAHVFYGFSVWNERNIALPWDEGADNTLEWFDLLGIHPVEKVYDGIYDEAEMRRVAGDVIDGGHEGVVFRVADAIPYSEFSSLAAKVVREHHVKSDHHWMHAEIKRNGLSADIQTHRP